MARNPEASGIAGWEGLGRCALFPRSGDWMWSHDCKGVTDLIETSWFSAPTVHSHTGASWGCLGNVLPACYACYAVLSIVVPKISILQNHIPTRTQTYTPHTGEQQSFTAPHIPLLSTVLPWHMCPYSNQALSPIIPFYKRFSCSKSTLGP